MRDATGRQRQPAANRHSVPGRHGQCIPGGGDQRPHRQIQTRDITAIGMLEQLTETHRLSPFPQVLATERPDRTASYLMQGYVAVLLEGSPYANIMPTTLWALMSTPEDVYSSSRKETWYGSFGIWVRFCPSCCLGISYP